MQLQPAGTGTAADYVASQQAAPSTEWQNACTVATLANGAEYLVTLIAYSDAAGPDRHRLLVPPVAPTVSRAVVGGDVTSEAAPAYWTGTTPELGDKDLALQSPLPSTRPGIASFEGPSL